MAFLSLAFAVPSCHRLSPANSQEAYKPGPRVLVQKTGCVPRFLEALRLPGSRFVEWDETEAVPSAADTETHSRAMKVKSEGLHLASFFPEAPPPSSLSVRSSQQKDHDHQTIKAL